MLFVRTFPVQRDARELKRRCHTMSLDALLKVMGMSKR